ncbi:MAG: alkaline phosphatase family protein [Acidimicrobiia bacterium]
MPIPRPPDYLGGGLVNLVAELETRLTGSAPNVRLAGELQSHVPSNSTYVMVLFDGLGSHQLSVPAASSLAAAQVGSLDAPFPTTTTVSLATIATGRNPIEHGIIGYMLWDPVLKTTLNTIHLKSVTGDPVHVNPSTFLPGSTVWERLNRAGIEPIVVQPDNFQTTPLTKALYRGARFEGYYSADDAVATTLDVASHPNRFVLLYVPFVDVAAHLEGQNSSAYREAVSSADLIWDRLTDRLGDDVTLVGTADHGHFDLDDNHKIRVPEELATGRHLYGDPRVLLVKGDPQPVLDLGHATWLDVEHLLPFWGPGATSSQTARRLPDGALFADDDWGLFPQTMNHRLIGTHGGLTDRERSIPFLVRQA